MKFALIFAIILVCATLAYTFEESESEIDFDEEIENLYNLVDELKVAQTYLHFIEQLGEKAWHFLRCMGLDWALHCSAPTLACLSTHELVACVELIECEAKDVRECSALLAAESANSTSVANSTSTK